MTHADEPESNRAFWTPEEAVRSIIAAAIAPMRLPPTRRLTVHYIRGLNNHKEVVFTPEFLFLLDAGLGTLAGVRTLYTIAGLGDPGFPDFSNVKLFSVLGGRDDQIIFPVNAGRLLVTARSGTPSAEVIEGLRPHTRSVEQISGDLYGADVLPFDEPRAASVIGQLPFVRSVDLDQIVRIIDGVSWFQTRVT